MIYDGARQSWVCHARCTSTVGRLSFRAVEIARLGSHRKVFDLAMHRTTALKILGLPIAATMSQIKAAYRIKAKQVHPDVGGTAAMFERLTAAYDVLLNSAVEPSAFSSDDLSSGPVADQSGSGGPDLSAFGPADDPLIRTDHGSIMRFKR
jgi:hypothetical protein